MTQTAGATHGWAHVSRERKRKLIEAIASGQATRGPVHAELDLTDRCNVACYFCNQQDTRSKLQIPLGRATDLIDELAARGLASVRLSGGGDPLHHQQILEILDHLAARSVVVDQITTNGVALETAVAQRLVEHEAREVHISLNSVDADDYRRMMQVRPRVFDTVIENVRRFLELRGERTVPMLTLQFLIDRANYLRVVEMYELGRRLGADRIAIGAVQAIPNARVQEQQLVQTEDGERLLPLLEEAFRRDRGHGALEVQLYSRGLTAVVAEARRRGGAEGEAWKAAASFEEKNGGCFFAWYTTTITGNGDVHPCCLLINPEVKPLGNIGKGPFGEFWNGPAYRQLRREMREALTAGADRPLPADKFERMQPVCLEPGLCWLKNGYFRADEEFYSELAQALDSRAMRGSWRRRWREHAGAFGAGFPQLERGYHRLRNSSRPARIWLKKRLRLPLTQAI